MTVDEFIRVFAAQRPNLDWVQAVQRLLPALHWEQVTALLAAIPRAGRRTHVELVRLLAPHLDRAQVAEVATIIATTKGAGSRLAALGCVADRLPDAQRDDAVAAAVRRAVKVPTEADDLLAWAAPFLPPGRLVATLRTLRARQDPGRHYQTLRRVVTRLPPSTRCCRSCRRSSGIRCGRSRWRRWRRCSRGTAWASRWRWPGTSAPASTGPAR
ncbi:hypothetical protein ACQEVZ_54125 [Dactylosporangium sp. CA-152071]|uniref:hypothetical protein n=1 Tax=Dactylosporangium sp. CA-152071 TaxID=3239933 RepID=UPI003D923B0E